MTRVLVMFCAAAALAALDFLTGLLRAAAKGSLSSSQMRTGGCHKLGELCVLAAFALFDFASGYFEIPGFLGTASYAAVFGYIVLMELLSILENVSDFPALQGLPDFLRRLFPSANADSK